MYIVHIQFDRNLGMIVQIHFFIWNSKQNIFDKIKHDKWCLLDRFFTYNTYILEANEIHSLISDIKAATAFNFHMIKLEQARLAVRSR